MTTQHYFFTRPRRWDLFCRLTLVVAQLLGLAGFTLADWQPARAAPVCTPVGDYMVCTFNYTGAPENWTAPAGVTEATFDLYGAAGTMNNLGIGRGGRVMATLAVTPGATYQIRVGGTDGYNGGGKGAWRVRIEDDYILWGGGASDLRTGAFALTDRLLVAGGGGGAGRAITTAGNYNAAAPGNSGGDGGYPNGSAGTYPNTPTLPPNLSLGGEGGTQSARGSGAFSGSLGQGGSVTDPLQNGGGGGGGYYGGEAGIAPHLGGGGGSSYGPADALFQNGARNGNGVVIITYRVKTTAVEPVCGGTLAQITCTVSLAYSGAPQLWTAPPGVTQATFDLYGAEGERTSIGNYYIAAGKGGRVLATLAITPGTTYQLLVGGQNGFNGGGAAGYGRPLSGGNGGGATDLRQRPFRLADRLLVAGGGGGAGAGQPPKRHTLGADLYRADRLAEGGESSWPGRSSPKANGGGGAGVNYGGVGGSLGAALINESTPGRTGSLGVGGTGGDLVDNPIFGTLGGGGGGGGYYGGGGGASGSLILEPPTTTPETESPGNYGFAAGGGGGSNYGPAGATFTNGVRTGDGMAIITYTIQDPPLPTNGTVSVWGDNTYGQLNLPAGLGGVTKIATGYRHTLALKHDGTVVAWGYNAYGQSTVPAGLTGVIALAAGDRHSLALKSDGTVVAWGENSQGQLNIPAGLNNVVAIASGPYHNLVLKSDGTVVGWGGNEGGQLNIPAGLTNVTAIATGMAFAVALKGDGTVVAWGDNTYKQLNVPAGLSGVIKIATGRLHTVAIKGDGSVVAWGYTCCYQIRVPAGLTGVWAVAGGGYHSLALKSDGTVVSWGDNTAGQRNLPASLSGIAAMSAGGFHTVLLSQDGGFQGLSTADATVAAAAAPNSELPVMEEAPEAMGSAESSEPAPAAPAVEAAPTQPPAEAPVEAPAPAVPSENNGSNQIFLPIITNLAGTALGTPGGLALLALVVVVIAGLVWQRRVRKH